MRRFAKLRKDEAGYALVWVLLVLIVAGLVLGPLLLLMGASLTSSHVHEESTQRFYAADAGIEDAIWKMKYGELGDDPYGLTVNGMQVLVTPLSSSEETMRMFFAELLDIPGGGSLHKSAPASDWMVVYGATGNEYIIAITYQPEGGHPAHKKIDGLGAWLYGDFDLVEGSAHGVTDAYPNYQFHTKNYGFGTGFIWEWKGGNRPNFAAGEEMIQTFEFEGVGSANPHVGWVDAGSDNIFISWSGAIYLGTIESEATVPGTDRSTTVTSYVFGGDTGEIIILSYTIE